MKLRICFLAGAFAFGSGLRAEPSAPPPAVTGSRPLPASGGHARPAAAGTQYVIGEPTDEEQLYLELLNRTRADALAEALRLANTTHPAILSAYNFFQVDLQKFVDDTAGYPAVQPLAFEPRLIEAARGHSRWMREFGLQSHNQINPDNGQVLNSPGDRLTTAGYPWFTFGESIFASASSVEQGHAGFEVDWGLGPGGLQDPPGHRISNHTAAFRELGVGVVNGMGPNGTGPQYVTFDFGDRPDSGPLVTGVAYRDLNGNQFYDLGEGIGGVTVNVSDSPFFAVTAASGGYAVPSANGPRTVTFSEPVLGVVAQAVTVAGGANVKADLRLAYAAPVLAGPALAFLGGPNTYTFAPVVGATGYVWESLRRPPFTAVLGAEAGLGDFTAVVSPGYAVVTTESRRSGSASYHLVTPTDDQQSLTLNARLRVTTGAQMTFATRLAWATTNQMARAQVSPELGANWVTVWEQPGRAVNNTATIEKAFTLRTASLAAFAGQEVAVRFTYGILEVNGASFFNQTNSSFGLFVDDLSFTGVEQLTAPTTNSVAGAAFAFTPPVAGNYQLRAAPQMGSRTLPPGPWLLVGTTTIAPPVVVVGPSGIVLGPNGNLRVDFKVTSGTPNSFALERADAVQGPWLPLSATLETNSPGNFSYKQIAPTGASGFLRVRAQ